ncbi:meiotic nuclear division protein 1 homolog isoform X3 [Colletes latitarsis]
MSRRKGVSLDEKRMRMLQIFYEKREFFTLKEIEKVASKEKGIVVQSVKDVLQALVDDGLVRSEKIGTSVYFWTFPGENITAIEQRISEASKKIVEAEFKLEKLKEACAKEKIGKEDTEERQLLLQELEELKAKEDQLKKQIAKFSSADPEVIAKLEDKAQVNCRGRLLCTAFKFRGIHFTNRRKNSNDILLERHLANCLLVFRDCYVSH